MLVHLLDFFRSDGKVVSRLTLRQADVGIGNSPAEALSEWQPSAVKILNDHVELASLAWQAYRQPTPQDWFDLLGRDLSVLPQLRQAALELLEELPMSGAGIGATEMRMLELISAGNAGLFRRLSRPPQAQQTTCLRLLGDREPARPVGSLSNARCVRPRRGAVHDGDARGS
jgi:hypothetical protein